MRWLFHQKKKGRSAHLNYQETLYFTFIQIYILTVDSGSVLVLLNSHSIEQYYEAVFLKPFTVECQALQVPQS